MRMTVQEFTDKFRSAVGDRTKSIPQHFILTGLNWAFNAIPTVPKLSKAFSKHYSVNLDANKHFKWDLNGDFRRLSNIPMLNFFTTTGGEPCPLKLCPEDNVLFYKKNGLVDLKKPGTPCAFTLEQEDDHIYLILDRPTNIPIIVDYIAYGYPKPVTSMEDTIELSAVIENLIMATLETQYYQEAQDFAFSGAVMDILDNKYLPEAIQMLNKRFGAEAPVILGEL